MRAVGHVRLTDEQRELLQRRFSVAAPGCLWLFGQHRRFERERREFLDHVARIHTATVFEVEVQSADFRDLEVILRDTSGARLILFLPDPPKDFPRRHVRLTLTEDPPAIIAVEATGDPVPAEDEHWPDGELAPRWYEDWKILPR